MILYGLASHWLYVWRNEKKGKIESYSNIFLLQGGASNLPIGRCEVNVYKINVKKTWISTII